MLAYVNASRIIRFVKAFAKAAASSTQITQKNLCAVATGGAEGAAKQIDELATTLLALRGGQTFPRTTCCYGKDGCCNAGGICGPVPA